MRLILCKFKKFDDLTIDINKDELTYIMGESGSGKTTIFEAILWVLYGKLQKVSSNNHSTTTRMFVQLHLDDGTVIYRQRNPSKLTVTLNDLTLEGEPAQQQIFKLEGVQDNFLLSSYLKQKKDHPFITATPTERAKLLLGMGKTNVDPYEVIEKVSAKIKEMEFKLKTISKDYDTLLNKYESVKDTVDESWILKRDALTRLKDNIPKINNTIDKLRKETIESTKLSTEKTLLLRQQNENKESLNKYLTYTRKQLSECKSQKQLYEEYLAYIKERDKLENKKSSLIKSINNLKINSDDGVSVERYDNNIIKTTITLEKDYALNKSICDKIGVDYNQESVNRKIKELKDLIDAQSVLNTLEKRSSIIDKKEELVTKMPTLPNISKERVTEDLTNLTTEHSKFINALDTERRDIISIGEENMKKKVKEVEDDYKLNLNKLKDKYDNINKVSRDVHRKKVDEIEKKISATKKDIENILRSKEVHICPHCKGSIRYIDGKIEASSLFPFNENLYQQHNAGLANHKLLLKKVDKDLDTSLDKSKEEENKELSELRKIRDREINNIKILNKDSVDKKLVEIDNKKKELEESFKTRITHLQSTLDTYILIQSLRDSISRLDEELASLPIVNIEGDYKKLTIKELGSTKSMSDDLKEIKFLTLPTISSSQMKICNEWHKYNDDIIEVDVNINRLKVVEKVDEITVDLNKYEYSVLEQERLNRDKIKIEKDIERIPKYRTIDVIKDEIGKYEDDLRVTKRDIDRSGRARDVRYMYEDLLDKGKEVDDLYSRLTKLREFKMDVQSSLSQSLEGAVDCINEFLLKSAPRVFNEPILVEITTTKIVKSTGVEKPSVGFNIKYANGTYSSPTELSGGECTRISTLIGLAFAVHYGSSMMILDEAVVYLGVDDRDKTIDFIRECLGDRCVIITCHDIHTGSYDNIIHLQK